ncbi:DUF3889 domain-containing protein [Lysinibacillus antri]|uniref:DUF3889 domain-containing protein n=2 Tax=Bacillaceae TaxID=186817 RepID=A0A432LGN5_9BACI|nr:DUF3889 domain-containing protein [Lysinibacillus antri]TSI08724.1 DUF3889 domain-containing protein [Lysinibacillus sp. BW-2-10]
MLILSTVVVGKILTTPPSEETVTAQELEQKPTPAYAKWGRLAMQEVMAKYPSADVIDYLHIGRETGSVTSVEKFKLWLRAEDNREFGVFVDITFNNQTEEVVNIQYTESTN